MRQAGRWLPEYRALKATRSFVDIVRTPDLATEATLQPLRRFPFDAAILFSDILVVPEALGHPYHFLEGGGGVRLESHVRTAADIDALPPATTIPGNLGYMGEAMRQVRGELGDRTALLGFAGAPWTIATYLAGDGGPAGAGALLALERENPAAFHALMERLADAATACLRVQIDNGADAVQIFDSWAALADSPGDATAYERRSLSWIRRVITALPPGTPVILFAKGVPRHAGAFATSGATVYSADAAASLPALRPLLGPRIALQGNLPPDLLLPENPPETLRAATRALLGSMHATPGHILNLAHGVPPSASLGNAEALFEELAAHDARP
jgi:uroporphyrinogen decarboxylase